MTHERDGQTDRRTPDDSIGRTYASHRAAKIKTFKKNVLENRRKDEHAGRAHYASC